MFAWHKRYFGHNPISLPSKFVSCQLFLFDFVKIPSMDNIYVGLYKIFTMLNVNLPFNALMSII